MTKSADQVVRIMIVDDHPTVREGLGYRIESRPDMMVCGNAADVNEALEIMQECGPDVVIVDIALKNSDGLDLIKAMRDRNKRARALVHSMYDESIYADRCLRAGAWGYVNKNADPDDVLEAIRRVHQGKVYVSQELAGELLERAVGGSNARIDPVETLSDRQLEIFRLIGQGKTAADIAKRLHISVHTVETHRENIKRKLNVTTVSELTCRAALWANDNQRG